jgi:hypothetical protein
MFDLLKCVGFGFVALDMLLVIMLALCWVIDKIRPGTIVGDGE